LPVVKRLSNSLAFSTVGKLQLENQRIGFEQALEGFVLALDDIGFFPEESTVIPKQLEDKLAACPYSIVQLSSGTLLNATLAALETNGCQDTLVGIIGSSESGSLTEVYQAIDDDKVAFVITEHAYLEGALPVVMSTLFATTGKKLAEPGSEYGNGAYLSGPRVITKANLPARQQQVCEVEGFPVCPSTKTADDALEFECPCFDRKKLVLAGVNHGVTTSSFWDEVFAGSLEAARDFGVTLHMPRIEEQVNDTLVHEKMAELILEFCEIGVDGLFVSLPSDLVFDAVKACLEKGVPVMSMNSGADYAVELGLLGHIGQLEFRGGESAGKKLIEAGVTRGLCVYQEENNIGLFERCSGMQKSFNESNIEFLGAVFASPTGDADANRKAIEEVVGEEGDWDGVGFLLCGTSLIPQALGVQKDHPSIKLGAFDVDTVLYDALKAKQVLFGIDQNSYLQGYLPIPFLTWYAQTGQILNNQFIESGPDFIEAAPSDAAIVCHSTFYEACAGATKTPVIEATSAAGTAPTLVMLGVAGALTAINLS
jgi:simple sugar transport system substrate-binding protein